MWKKSRIDTTLGRRSDVVYSTGKKWDVRGLGNDGDTVCVCLPCSEKRVGNVYSKAKSFVDYVRRALRRLELDESKVRIKILQSSYATSSRSRTVGISSVKTRCSVKRGSGFWNNWRENVFFLVAVFLNPSLHVRFRKHPAASDTCSLVLGCCRHHIEQFKPCVSIATGMMYSCLCHVTHNFKWCKPLVSCISTPLPLLLRLSLLSCCIPIHIPLNGTHMRDLPLFLLSFLMESFRNTRTHTRRGWTRCTPLTWWGHFSQPTRPG